MAASCAVISKRRLEIEQRQTGRAELARPLCEKTLVDPTMTSAPGTDCKHTERVAELHCGSYFVKCALCQETLITIPWFSAETLLAGNLTVHRTESPEREKVAEGPAEHLIPHIRHILMCYERLALTGPHAVINETQLGDIKNNSLTVQRDYFSHVVSVNPRDEFAPFALAQVLRELGDLQQADAHYDAGLAAANANWLRKLPLFALPSIVLAAILWQQSFAPWLCAIIGVVGPAMWLLIRRNRRRWLPMVGFAERAETAAKVDMAAALSIERET